MTALASDKAKAEARYDESPFKPLFTVRRSGRIELTVFGIVSVVSGARSATAKAGQIDAHSILATGDIDYQLWSRSCLKPWQLLSNYQILKDNYPALSDRHLALCMASHSGEPEHIKALEEILAITGIDESCLKCPPASPLDTHAKDLMKEKGEKPRRRYHNCSGKHSGFLAAVKASEGESHMKDYLAENAPHHQRIRSILSKLTGRPADTFSATTDGCQLANFALSTRELSYFYLTLLNPRFLPAQATEDALFAPYADIAQLMLKNPLLISGHGRTDYGIMTREFFADAPPMVAKEGADGLLGIGVAANDLYPEGLGITIKLSAGFDPPHMQLIARKILSTLGLTKQATHSTTHTAADPESATIRTDHIKTEFHFLENLQVRT